MSFDEVREGLGRAPDDAPRVSFQVVAMRLGLLFLRERSDVDRVVEELPEPHADPLFAQHLPGDSHRGSNALDGDELLVEHVGADVQMDDSEILDFSQALPGQFVVLAPERVGLELAQRQHARVSRGLEAFDQMGVMKERLPAAEVDPRPGDSEPLQFSQVFPEVFDRQQGAFPRTAVHVAIGARCVAAIREHDARGPPSGESERRQSPPQRREGPGEVLRQITRLP